MNVTVANGIDNNPLLLPIHRHRRYIFWIHIVRLKHLYRIPKSLWSRTILVIFCWYLILLLQALAGFGGLPTQNDSCRHNIRRQFSPKMRQNYTLDFDDVVGHTPRVSPLERRAVVWYEEDLDVPRFMTVPQGAFPTPTSQKKRTETINTIPASSPPQHRMKVSYPPYRPYDPFDLDNFDAGSYDQRQNAPGSQAEFANADRLDKPSGRKLGILCRYSRDPRLC